MSDNAPKEPTGYSLPLSPSGRSSMVTEPPWHFSGRMLWIDYRVSPDSARAFLPSTLSPDADPGAAAAVFSEWQWCSTSMDELDDPVRCQFSEFQILLGSRYEGRPVARCPYAWVDSAVSLVRGWIQGMPKQFGTVRMTIPVGVGRAGGRLEAGGRFAASLAVSDRRLVDARVTLSGRVESPPALSRVPLVHSLVTPGWTGAENGDPRLVRSRVDAVEFSPVWAGDADLTFHEGAMKDLDPDLASLLPLEVGSGYHFEYAETLVGGESLS
ncbi:acetoacetate decarboxylase family protein [Streptomyces xanthophaeus]|uniref:acetoacetate decarboxylase family protein n=1 Tax=Streptomyces xanthophaeus TaxID=67385 RepID=UPI0004CCC6B7|nr:acetoacetate decarboxylase family protein [Streptomyces xanthophaeus]